MKKVFSKINIFSFLLGAVLFSAVSVFAFSFTARDASYSPLDTTWKKEDGDDILNVEDALNELHLKVDDIVLDDLVKLTDGVKFEGEYFYIYTPKKIIWNEASENIINYEKIVFCHKVAGNNTNFTADLPFSVDNKTFEVKLIKKIGNYGWNPSIRPPTSGKHLDVDVNYGYPELAEYYFLILIK